MSRARLFLAACALAAVGLGAAAAAQITDRDAKVELSTKARGTTRTTQDLRDLFIPEDVVTTTTTTLPPLAVTTTTAKPPRTTTTDKPVVTTTTAKPVTTTTAKPSTEAVLYVENKTLYEVKVSVLDVTGNTWTLAPGQKVGPWTLETSNEHGDSGSVIRTDSPCGAGDGEDYFKGGHTYRLEVRDTTEDCEGKTAPRITVVDLTTGTSDEIY